MRKTRVIKAWIEMSDSFLHDGPPNRHDYLAFVFVNRCELRETTHGKRYLHRNTDVEHLRAGTEEEMQKKISAFAQRADVRLLVKGLETNDFKKLPRHANDPPTEIAEGTADIYQSENEKARY